MNGQFNLPALWRMTKFYSFSYPQTGSAASASPRSVVLDLKKYLTADNETLSRMRMRVSGNIVKTVSGAGTATGRDNPTGLLISSNLSTAPIYGNCAPYNQVSSRANLIDGMYNEGWRDTFTAMTDANGTQAVDFWVEYDFRRSDGTVIEGIDYALALGKYTSLPFTMVFGGREQLFTGGTSAWDLSGLTVDLYADLDIAVNPAYIHASELFEQTFNITASSSDFKIDTLSSGFVYTDLYILSEEANALAAGIVNNISISSGGQVWLQKGEANAAGVQDLFAKRNNRAITGDGQTFTGIYAIPLRDGMFTRGYDQRFSPPLITLDVTAGAATVIRLVGRRMIPGGIYKRPLPVKK